MARGRHPVNAGRGTLGELARLFLRLGVTAFGGPAAHVGLMEDEIVRRRGWMTRGEFLDLLGAANLIPGPNSTELAIHVGHRRAGWPGLVVAGACFIVPAALLTAALAWAYVRYGARPQAAALLYGIKPVIIAIVVQALWRLARTALKTVWLGALAALSVIAVVAGVHELIVLFGAGVIAYAVASSRRGGNGGIGRVTLAALAKPGRVTLAALAKPGRVTLAALAKPGRVTLAALAKPAPTVAGTGAGAAAVAVPFGLWPLFLTFAKIGAVLFGSGYVLLAFLRADFVERLHWLTEAQLIDAVAAGQVTPGPVFSTATFVGYLLGGAAGAVVATLGIFLPAFAFVALSGPLVPRLRTGGAGAFLDGVNAASLALMAVVTAQLGRASLIDAPTALLALASLAAVTWSRWNTAWIVGAGGLAGLLVHALR